MSHEQNARTLEKMLALAQFGADGHKERRQVEFRVFISYITVLVIALYQVNKPKDPIFQNSDNVWIPLLLFFIHVLYCLWQKNISIALINDVRRRDFYLQKAQCLSYHLSQHSNVVFQPSWTKTVSLNKGGGRSSKPITEVDLFKERHPNIIQKASLSEFRKIFIRPAYLVPDWGSNTPINWFDCDHFQEDCMVPLYCHRKLGATP